MYIAAWVYFKSLIALAGLVAWIAYWAELAKYQKLLRRRALLTK